MTQRRNLFAATLLSLLATVSTCAYAKKVRIRWKPLPGATRYELEFRRGETLAATQQSAENVTDLRVVLAPGRYRYRLRGYDRADRAGEWSRDLPLTVSPTKPKTALPADGTKWTLRNGSDEADLTWTDGEKPDRWRLEVVQDGELQTYFIAGNEDPKWSMPEPETGRYRWRVRGEVGGPVPVLPLGAKDARKSTDSGDWKPGAWSSWSDFTLVVSPEYLRARGRLKAPTIRLPASDIVLPPGGAVQLAWEPVTAAQGYEVRVDVDGKGEGTWTPVGGTNTEVQLSPGDRVKWFVRATAGRGADRAAGPEASSTINTETVVAWPTETRFGVAFLGESYSLGTETGGAGLPRIRGTSSGTAPGIALSHECWTWGRYGWYANGEYLYRQPNSVAQALAISFGGSARFVLGGSLSPWSLRATLGVRYQDQPVLEPNDPALPFLNPTATKARRSGLIGPEASVTIERRITNEWIAGFTLGTMFPLGALTHDGTDGVESASPTGNLLAKVRVDWRFSPTWDFRFEGSYRTQSTGTRLAAPLNGSTTTSNLSRLGIALGVGWRWD